MSCIYHVQDIEGAASVLNPWDRIDLHPCCSYIHEKMDVWHLGPNEIVHLLISSNQMADVWPFHCYRCTCRQHTVNSQARLSCSSRAHAALCFKNVPTCRFLPAGLSVLFILIIYLITWDKLNELFLTVFAAERQAHVHPSRTRKYCLSCADRSCCPLRPSSIIFLFPICK